MKDVVSNAGLVARCGLYCGACRSYLKGRCPGCGGNEKASWCAVRACCMGNGYSSCAECRDFEDPRGCPKFNNAISRLIGFALRSDRAACIAQIREKGLQGHADIMAGQKRHTIRKGSSR